MTTFDGTLNSFEKIVISATTDTTSTSTGAMVVAGGIGINSGITTNNMSFGTSGGVPGTLNYVAEYMHISLWNGVIYANYTARYNSIKRFNSLVIVMMTDNVFDPAYEGVDFYYYGTNQPMYSLITVPFVPSQNVYMVTSVANGLYYYTGTVSIDTNGYILGYVDFEETFFGNTGDFVGILGGTVAYFIL